jgi:hypothetical protein
MVGLLGCVLVLSLSGALTSPVEARIVKNQEGDETNDPKMVFGRIARAWEEGDQQTLADLVHEGGLQVTTGGTAGRTSQYSPSQAFYYFKNVFHTHRTLIFTFEKMQDASAGERVHGMAVWQRRRPDSEKIQEVKLVCVLAKQGDQWMLAEINKIR